MPNQSFREVVQLTWEGDQVLTVDLAPLIVLNTTVDTSDAILVEDVTEGADNFHICLNDVVQDELEILECLVNC